MRAVALLHHTSAPSRAERLYRKVFALLHLRRVVVLDEQNGLSGVDLVWVDGVSAEILNRLYCGRSIK